MFKQNLKAGTQVIKLIKEKETFATTAYWDITGYAIGYGNH